MTQGESLPESTRINPVEIGHHQSVKSSTSYVHDVLSLLHMPIDYLLVDFKGVSQGTQFPHSRWHWHVLIMALTQLSLAIETPGKYLSLITYGKAMVGRGVDVVELQLLEISHLGRLRVVLDVFQSQLVELVRAEPVELLALLLDENVLVSAYQVSYVV